VCAWHAVESERGRTRRDYEADANTCWAWQDVELGDRVPLEVREPIRQLLGGIGLDPCTEPDNPTGADHFYCLPADGCAADWVGRNVFCNPPYGEARNRWVEKCIAVGRAKSVVLLIPSHTETRIFQRALEACTTVLLCQARLRFGVLRENGRH